MAFIGLWILIAVLVVILIVLFKMRELRHHIGLVAIVLLLLFFVVSFSQIYSNTKADLKTFDGFIEITKVYGSWLANAGSNFIKVSGFAVQQNWSISSNNK